MQYFSCMGTYANITWKNKSIFYTKLTDRRSITSIFLINDYSDHFKKILLLISSWTWNTVKHSLIIKQKGLQWRNKVILMFCLLSKLHSSYLEENKESNRPFLEIFNMSGKMHAQILLGVQWWVMCIFLFLRFYNFVKGIACI